MARVSFFVLVLLFTAVAVFFPTSVEAKTVLAVPILEYHDVGHIPHDRFSMNPGQFKEEVAFLQHNGFHSVTLDELYAAFYTHGSLPHRPVVITLDDGYQSTYTTAYPVLRRYGFRATVFMVSGFANRRNFMTVQELQEIQRSGVIRVESHTVTHPSLSLLPDKKAIYQLLESKCQLSRDVYGPVEDLCYPNGNYNVRIIQDVRKTGYRMAFTTRQGYATPMDGPYQLKRIAVYQGDSLQHIRQLLAPSFRS